MFECAQRVGATPFKRATDRVGDGFGQNEISEYKVGSGEGRGGIEWRAGAECGQYPANQRPQNKANAKGSTDQAKVFCLVLWSGNVGHKGGGGGLSWFEEDTDKRVNDRRVEQAAQAIEKIGTDEPSVIVTSCPFCMTMIEDGLAAGETTMIDKDIAELVAEAMDKTDT